MRQSSRVFCGLFLTWAGAGLLLTELPGAAFAQTNASCEETIKEEKKPSVVFDHLNQNRDTAYTVRAANGEEIVICIDNTLEAEFNYEIRAAERFQAPGGPTPASRPTLTEADLKPKILRQVHDSKNGGYFVDITQASPQDPPVISTGGRQVTLNTVHLFITVLTAEWDQELAGGFTVSRLNDPVFSVRPRTVDGAEKKFVVEDDDAEDEARLGMGAMIHIFHTNLSWLAGTFGLGINDDNRTTYYAGPTFRFGDKAALTLGFAFGSVSRLPNGVNTTDPVTDDNVLANLGSKVKGAPFISFSYTFLNPGLDKLKKPFLGQEQAPQGGGTTEPARPAVTKAASTKDSDGDGVPDLEDEAPCDKTKSQRLTGEAKDTAGKRDSDGDNILDELDPEVCKKEGDKEGDEE